MDTIINYPQIEIDRILPNPEQPRKTFDATELRELADSILANGVIEPVVVEEAGDFFILHDGERRVRAARLAGSMSVPAVISPPLNGTGPLERLTRALVANIQRADMSPVDEALAMWRMKAEFGLSIHEIAKQIGKAYTTVNLRMKLAQLNPEIQALMREKRLSTEPRAVQALLSIKNEKARIALARELASRKASATAVVKACNKFNVLQNETKEQGTPATRALRRRSDQWPEWDALYAIGKVPPWPAINDRIMSTCDACALRPVASESTCNGCALVVMVRGLMEDVNGYKP